MSLEYAIQELKNSKGSLQQILDNGLSGDRKIHYLEKITQLTRALTILQTHGTSNPFASAADVVIVNIS